MQKIIQCTNFEALTVDDLVIKSSDDGIQSNDGQGAFYICQSPLATGSIRCGGGSESCVQSCNIYITYFVLLSWGRRTLLAPCFCKDVYPFLRHTKTSERN